MSSTALPGAAAPNHPDLRRLQIRGEQVRLLNSNLNLAVVVTALASSMVSALQWAVVSHPTIVAWWVYMCAVSVGRHILGRRYQQDPPPPDAGGWATAFAVGAGLSGLGWASAAVLLYVPDDLTRQVYLIFVLGGMMLGAATLLAPRREAFLAFLIPTGLAPAARLLFQGDPVHLFMGLLACIFTVATLASTNRIYRTILASLELRFENHDLVEDLRRAKAEAEALNDELEVRVDARTAELRLSTEQLQAEIAHREEIESELLRARKLESLGVLAGGIAHDFNNFLTVVQGNIELARMYVADQGPVQGILDETQTACRRAAFLASQLLTFAKGGAPVRQVTSLSRLIADSVQLIRAGAQVSVDVDIDKDLWCADVDPGQIGQVLHNILLNARQSMPDGGIIEVRAENVPADRETGATGLVRISIRDYGHGIPHDVLPRVFDPYFTTKPGGRGLGLATSYAIVIKHGGSVSVESKPGVGSVFTIDLPATGRPPDPAPEAAPKSQTGAGRILVMDDEDAVRKLMATVLANSGYEVLTARDGAEAIALWEDANAAGRDFDVALLDLTVSGGMGGVETAARLKMLAPSLKLIVSSGYSDGAVMSDFRRYGFDDVLPKPWNVSQLTEVVRKVCARNPDRAG